MFQGQFKYFFKVSSNSVFSGSVQILCIRVGSNSMYQGQFKFCVSGSVQILCIRVSSNSVLQGQFSCSVSVMNLPSMELCRIVAKFSGEVTGQSVPLKITPSRRKLRKFKRNGNQLDARPSSVNIGVNLCESQ